MYDCNVSLVDGGGCVEQFLRPIPASDTLLTVTDVDPPIEGIFTGVARLQQKQSHNLFATTSLMARSTVGRSGS